MFSRSTFFHSKVSKAQLRLQRTIMFLLQNKLEKASKILDKKKRVIQTWCFNLYSTIILLRTRMMQKGTSTICQSRLTFLHWKKICVLKKKDDLIWATLTFCRWSVFNC